MSASTLHFCRVFDEHYCHRIFQGLFYEYMIDSFNGLEYTRQSIDSYTDVDSMKPKPDDYIMV